MACRRTRQPQQKHANNKTTVSISVQRRQAPCTNACTLHPPTSNATSLARPGMSNTTTTHCESKVAAQMQDIALMKCMYSHCGMFMMASNTTVTPWQHKRVLRYRNGLLLTCKLLHQYKRQTKLLACLLCGKQHAGLSIVHLD